MTPEISVIIPTYNRRAMLSEALASVRAQHDASFEVIVVDDGSTDRTWDDLAAAEGAVRAIRIEHRGPAAARNRGLALARGGLIAFLDSDDLWMPAKLSRQARFMREHPACAISQSTETWMRNGRRVNPGRRHRKRAGDIFIDSLRTCLISPSAVIVRRELLEQTGGFDEDMQACEDYDLWLRIAAHNHVGLLDEPLVMRRAGHPGQLSVTLPALDRFRILALAKLLADETLQSERRMAVAEVMAEKCRIFGNGLERRGRSEEAAFFAGAARLAETRWRDGADADLATAYARMRGRLRDDGAQWLRRADAAAAAQAT
ncbi:MAG TPA: glycosyltransferase [Candidatus Binataceae bacterium]|nr:glycosyltransferase [Candidatus Binataceae bacterium]